jgi:hypothetical protein
MNKQRIVRIAQIEGRSTLNKKRAESERGLGVAA